MASIAKNIDLIFYHRSCQSSLTACSCYVNLSSHGRVNGTRAVWNTIEKLGVKNYPYNDVVISCSGNSTDFLSSIPWGNLLSTYLTVWNTIDLKVTIWTNLGYVQRILSAVFTYENGYQLQKWRSSSVWIEVSVLELWWRLCLSLNHWSHAKEM